MSLHNPQPSTIVYPETDGKPMAETDVHRDLMSELIRELKMYFQHEPDVYISGNLLVYYVEGNPRQCFAPDVFVVRGVGNHQRRTYKLWEEGRAPEVVFEISSRQTWGDDLQRKWKLYEQLRVAEYFIFDPEYDYLMEPLVAYRLEAGEYAPLEVKDGRVMSEALGLELVDTGETLRLFDPHAQRFLPTTAEEAESRSRAEADAANLRAEVEGLRQRLSSDS
ncbi:MAG: Uma2 family endonuclease [Acidobacteriota bacterium]|nr:Uma2 family endonuclease [Acidobacteriota bacterium]